MGKPDIPPLPDRFRIEIVDMVGNALRSCRRQTERSVDAFATELLRTDERVIEVIAHDSQPEPGQFWWRLHYKRIGNSMNIQKQRLAHETET